MTAAQRVEHELAFRAFERDRQADVTGNHSCEVSHGAHPVTPDTGAGPIPTPLAPLTTSESDALARIFSAALVRGGVL